MYLNKTEGMFQIIKLLEYWLPASIILGMLMIYILKKSTKFLIYNLNYSL